MLKRVLLFLVLNLTALAVGSLYTKTAVAGDWYVNLNKAPWTPPGYMFGIAWSIIMICFGFYMAYLTPLTNKNTLFKLFALQWVLNVGWNPIFFYFQQTQLGLFTIIVLTILISIFTFKYFKTLQYKSFLILPYLLWLIIATSLNSYIVLFN